MIYLNNKQLANMLNTLRSHTYSNKTVSKLVANPNLSADVILNLFNIYILQHPYDYETAHVSYTRYSRR